MIPAVRVGWEVEQNDILIGLQVLFFPGPPGQSSPFEIAVPITYRRYFKQLVTGGFAPFAEVSLDLDLWGSGGTDNQVAWGIGGSWGLVASGSSLETSACLARPCWESRAFLPTS